MFGDHMMAYLAILVCIMICELISAKVQPKLKTFAFRFRIALRWNFLLVTVLGSMQAAIFYSILQVITYTNSYSPTGSDLVGLILAVVFMTTTIVIPILICWRVFTIKQFTEFIMKNFWGYYFISMFAPIKSPKVKDWPIIYFGLMIKAVVASLLIGIGSVSGLIQVACYLALCIAFLLYISIRRPYTFKYMFIFQIIWECVTLVYLTGLLILAIQDNRGDTGESLRNMGSYLTVFSAFAIPCLNVIFVIYELVVLPLLRRRRRKNVAEVEIIENVEIIEEEEEIKAKRRRKARKGMYGDADENSQLNGPLNTESDEVEVIERVTILEDDLDENKRKKKKKKRQPG